MEKLFEGWEVYDANYDEEFDAPKPSKYFRTASEAMAYRRKQANPQDYGVRLQYIGASYLEKRRETPER